MQVNLVEIHVFIDFSYFGGLFQGLFFLKGLQFVKIFQVLCLFGGLRLFIGGIFLGSMLIWGFTLIRKSRVCSMKYFKDNLPFYHETRSM